MKEEIKELQYTLDHLGEGDSMIGNDIIMPQGVVGVDWDKVDRLYERYMNRIAKLQKECELVEEYIESIEDSMTRRIFRMYFLEGMKQKDIAKAMNVERSTVSRRIYKAFCS